MLNSAINYVLIFVAILLPRCTIIACADGEAWDRGQRQTLIDHYTFLGEEMEAEGTLLNYLLQYEVLDEQETAEIRAIAVRQRKNEKLLDFVMRTTSEQYDKFLEALKESKQEHVCNELLGNFGNKETLPCASADQVDNCNEKVRQTSVEQAASIENVLGPSQRVEQAADVEKVLGVSQRVKQTSSIEKVWGSSLRVGVIVGTADPELPPKTSPGKF